MGGLFQDFKPIFHKCYFLALETTLNAQKKYKLGNVDDIHVARYEPYKTSLLWFMLGQSGQLLCLIPYLS